jgi:hypothetical protein
MPEDIKPTSDPREFKVYDPSLSTYGVTPRTAAYEQSRYDTPFVIPEQDLGLTLQKMRAENQGALMSLGTAAANLIPNTALSVVESAAHLADIEDWSNMIQGNKANYGNVLTEWASQNKNYFGEVYRKSSDAGFDITDSAWWVSNGAGLVESVAAFGLTGYGVGSVLGKGASSLSKALNAYGKAKMGIELSAQVGTSGVLAFTEGTMTGAQVFKDVYPEAYNSKLQEILQQGAQQYGEDNLTEEYYKYADTAAKQFANEVAGESATKAVRINMANTFLNLPETGALFRSMSANRYLDDALRITKGEKFDDYVARIKSFDTAKHITREGIKSKIQQTGGEALEEMVNIYAEQEGKNVSRKAMDKDIVSLGEMLADDDIWAAGFWGAIGGSMQSFVMNKMPKWVTQEDGTTKRTTIGEYNKEQVTNKYEEQLGDLKDRLTEFVTAKDNLVKASQTNDEKLYNESINTIFKYNSFNSIVKGVEEQLIDDYSRIMTLSSEEAAQQGFKGDYKQDAANKIQSIRENTAEWNKIQDRYMSQDLDLAGYPETIFQQFINVENNKKIIAEQEFEINKLQSDINQSYALKGTDLTIAAYNDIVSSIRALDNDFELETIDLENLLNLQGFDKNTQKRIVAKLNNKYGNLENAKTQIEKNLDNIREKANDLARTFKLQRENFDIQVDPENKLSQEEKDRMFAQILSENEFEIDALTEAKSQLQRNRETLRAQEEELRNLKSKDGVNKFKELKRQKLTEQNGRVEQEVVEEQEQQAEAERQAQQEVVDDIRRRQEEEPETVTEEEVITLQQLEELEEQEGETYQEGEYTGEGSTPKELDKQYEDILDSANKSDEEGRVFDQQGNLVFVDDKLVYSFNKIAYASTVEYSEDETTGVIKHTSLELNPETNPDLLTTKFVAGTPIKIKKLEAKEFKKPFPAPRKITFIDELGREVLVANKGETVTFEMLYHPYMQPIGIYDDSNNLIGMLHDVTYVRPERVLQQSLEEDRNNLIALRSKIGNDFIETTIVGKTNGHINQFRDGFRKLSELMPGPIEFAIATSSIQLNTSKTTIVDDLINKPKYKVGQVYAITYTPNGQKIAIPVKTTQVKEHPEVLNELLAAFDAFAEGKISQNQLKEVFSKYIYSTPTSEKLDAAGKNFKREVDNKDRMYIDYDSLNVDGIVFGKSGDTKRFLSSRTPKEDIEKLRKIFISILSESYININFEKVRNESFVKNFTTSNVRFYKLPDGRVTVFDNPVISISTSFAPGIKPIEKTEEQPRVEPEPVSTDAKADIERRRQEISSFFNKNDYTTEVTLENDEYTLKVYDKKSTFLNVPIFKFQGNIIDIDGKKYINVYEVSTKKEYQNKKIATNSYKYILENLPSGVKGLYSFSEMRKGVMVPNIYKTLSKDYTVTTDSKGNILVNYDAELAALEQPTVDIKGDIKARRQEKILDAVSPIISADEIVKNIDKSIEATSTNKYDETDYHTTYPYQHILINNRSYVYDTKNKAFYPTRVSSSTDSNLESIEAYEKAKILPQELKSLNKTLRLDPLSSRKDAKGKLIINNTGIFEGFIKSTGISSNKNPYDVITNDERFKDIVQKIDSELAALQPTIQPEETKTTFTSNNGLEFDIDFEDDVDLLPMFTEVKSGVQELFDSNPELANQVYEALGFNQLITSNDRIVFGHPTIGKSYLKKQGEDKFISLDDDYATEINNKVKEIADKYNVTTYQVKDGGTQKWNNEYNQMMQEMFNVAKQRAISENKTLFTSNTNLLRNNAESFDKVINLTDVEFEKRIQERGAKYNIKEWKSQINEAISKIPTSKVINTNKYLSDLFITPEQKQQALQLYSQYLDTIFPDSQVKDVVYHGAMEQLLPKDGKFKGYVTYFSTTKKYSETFGFPINRKVIQAVVNIANPYNAPSELADVPEEIHNTDEFTNPRIIKSKKLGYDSVIGVDAGQKEGGTIAIFEPEQIHVLGTKQDIEGFNQFVQSGKQIEKSLSLQDKVINLIKEGKITKFCK